MKWRAPLNFGALTYQGVRFTADANGEIDLSRHSSAFVHSLVSVLPAHGFLPCGPAAAPRAPLKPAEPIDPIDAMNRGELFAYIKARGGSANIALKNDELRALARSLDALQGVISASALEALNDKDSLVAKALEEIIHDRASPTDP